MGETQGPESQVTGGVRDCSQDKLDHLDHLVDKDLAHLMSLLFKSIRVELFFRKLVFNQLFAQLLFILLAKRMSKLILMFRVFNGKNDWLGNKHQKWANKCYNKKTLLKIGLLESLIVSVEILAWKAPTHIDKYWYNRWCIGAVAPIDQPLHDYRQTHIAKSSKHKDQLGNKLKEKVNVVLEVDCVYSLHANPQ